MNLLNMNRPEKPVRAALAVLLLWCSVPVHAEQYTVPLFVSASAGGGPQGVLRLVNGADADAAVSIRAIDDAGHRTDAATLTLGAGAAVQLSAAELQSGNAAKGLPAGLGTLAGDVRLAIDSDLPVVPSAYVRGADGALAEMNATVLGAADASRFPGAGQTASAGEDGRRYDIALFHPAGHAAQPSRLRLVNANDAEARVTIGARDDAGNPAPGGSVQLTLPAGGARTLTAQQLEAGDGASLTGRLGAGVGNWRLSVSSDRPIQALNVTLDAAGGWRNLSTTAVDGWAPADAAAFEARFLGRALVLRNGEAPGGFHVRAQSRFADLGAPGDGTQYAYERAGRDTGRVQLQSAECGVNLRIDLYFAAAGEGWYNSACADGLEPGEYRGGGMWMALPPQAVPLDLGGELADRVLAAGAPIAAIALPEAAGGPGGAGAGGRSYTLSPEVPGLSFDPATHRLAGTPSEAGDYLMTYTVRAASGDRDWRRFRLAVPGGAGGRSATFAAGDTLSGLPADGWRPEGIANGTFRVEGGGAAAELGHRGHFESGGQRYTCVSVDGCAIRGRRVGDGSVIQTPLAGGASMPGDEGGFAGSFDLAGDGGPTDLSGIAHADGRLFMVDIERNKVYAFTASGDRDPAADFELLDGSGSYDGITYANRGITYADGRFFVIDWSDEKVYAYTASGDRDPAADFELVNSGPRGIAYADGRFFVVDWLDEKVYAYTASGDRDPAADFELFDDDGNPEGITYADGRFFVEEAGFWDGDYRGYVYAYTASGDRDPAADFELVNSGPRGIAYADGRFFVVDWLDEKVYAYTASGDRDPTADFSPIDGSSSPIGIAFANGRVFVVDRLDEKVYAYTASGDRDPAVDFDLFDSNQFLNGLKGIAFADGRFFVVDHYPFENGKAYAYTASGDRDPAADFDLFDRNQALSGIAFADGRLFFVDDVFFGIDKVYAYTASGDRDPAADFDLIGENGTPEGIAYANGRFHIVDGADDKVYAYTASGIRDPAADFELFDDNESPSSITYADGRFLVVDVVDGKVYAYAASETGRGDTDDHGGDPTSATPAAIGSDAPGALTAGDTDYFRIDVDASGTLEVYTTGGIDTAGRLEDGSGAPVRSDDDGGAGGNFRISQDVEAGTYYLRVEGGDGQTAGDYTLHVRFAEADSGTPPPPTASDGDCYVGLRVNPGGSCAYPGSDDEFTVTADGRGRFQFFTAGNAIDIASGNIDFAASHQGGGVWRIDRVGSAAAPAGGGADDHGDSRATATPAAIGSDTPGTLTAGDTDYFRIVVSQSGTLEVYTTGGIDTVGRLEDASGAPVRNNDDGGAGNNFRISAAVSAGTYFVRVTGYSSRTAGDYTLHVRFGDGDAGGGEPFSITGECSGTRDPLFSTATITITGTLTANRDASNVRVLGYAGDYWDRTITAFDNFVGEQSLGDMNAGQTESYSLSGSVYATSQSRFGCRAVVRHGDEASFGAAGLLDLSKGADIVIQ